MSSFEGAANLINHLIRTCVEGCRGYEAAADAVADPRIKTELANYSLQRQRFASELQTRLPMSNAPEPASKPHIEAHSSSSWIFAPSNAKRDSHNVLAACKHVEDATVDAYRSALGADVLPDEYAMLIEAQYEAIQNSHDRIKILSHATANHWMQ
jgi:uncharacterized protein (TIGR02284 family)